MTGSISAIGSYGGLGSAGLYGSYYDPSMMAAMSGYNSSYGVTNPALMNGIGMSGMYNPMMNSMGMMNMYNPAFMAQQTEFMKQMYSAQNEIQKMQIQHQADLHTANENAQVQNIQSHNDAFFRTIISDGDFKDIVREMYTGIRDGKMDYVAQKYFELRQAILNKYGSHFKNSPGSINDNANLNQAISVLYSEYGAGFSGDGIKPDLRTDILKYGENALQHGFNTAFMGNKDHTKSTAEEALYKIYGTPIEDKGSKEKAHMVGAGLGHVTETLTAGATGAAAGAGIWGLSKLFNIGGKFGNYVKAVAAAAAIGDIFWQLTR